MNHEDIKKGDIYNVRIRVLDVDDDTGDITTETVDKNGQSLEFEWNYFAKAEAAALTPINSENGIKNSEPSPKYDPYRELRAGDKVKLKSYLGRNPYDIFDGSEYIPDDTIFTVLRDEWTGGKVDIFEQDESDAFSVHFSNLELVTPVEELEPYNVFFEGRFVHVRKGEQVIASFNLNAHPNAKQAAEAECARLNAEHRKENSHE